MNLNSVNDETLITKIENLVREEREILMSVLHVLREIDRRRLYSSLGYKSLFDFAVRRLGYPEDQAYRRISAMRLLKELPEIEEKIVGGELSLSHIGLAQSLFRQEKKLEKEMSQDQKLEVLEKIAGRPVREAERMTLAMSSAPEIAKPDRMNLISAEHIEIKFKARREVESKIERLKGYLAHKHPNISLGELFETLCDLGLEKFDRGSETAASRKRCVIKPRSQAQVKREVFQNARSQCENCGSTYALEIEHIIPQAKRGPSSPDNLRLFCRRAIKEPPSKSLVKIRWIGISTASKRFSAWVWVYQHAFIFL